MLKSRTEANAAFNEAVRSLDEAHHDYEDGDFEGAHRKLSNAGWLIHQLQQDVYTHLELAGKQAITAGRR